MKKYLFFGLAFLLILATASANNISVEEGVTLQTNGITQLYVDTPFYADNITIYENSIYFENITIGDCTDSFTLTDNNDLNSSELINVYNLCDVGNSTTSNNPSGSGGAGVSYPNAPTNQSNQTNTTNQTQEPTNDEEQNIVEQAFSSIENFVDDQIQNNQAFIPLVIVGIIAFIAWLINRKK